MNEETKHELIELARTCPPEHLAAFLADLEEARLVGFARLIAPTAAPQPERRITASEAASRIGISKQLFYRNAREGKYSFVTHEGRRLLAIASGLEKYLRTPR